MELVLYAPGLWLLRGGRAQIRRGRRFHHGARDDGRFSRRRSRPDVGAVLAASTDRVLIELGAGSGALAADLLVALARAGASPSRYLILEVSPGLARAAARRDRTAGAIRSSRASNGSTSCLPAIDGVILMNEVLDAIAPHLVARKDDVFLERGVAWRGVLAWEDRPLSNARLRTLAAERFPPQGDYLSEINPAAEALVETLAHRMTGGALVIIDYGFPQHEFYHRERREGTLMAHYRHRAHIDPLLWPGLTDVTAHVDFTAMALAGERGGLTVAGYTSLAAFLVASAILDRLAETGEPTSTAYLREAAAVQKLLSPAEMGELFKVLALVKSDGVVWSGFAAGDRTHRL
jgi:SAM-dependent MidA family methyltransferase